MNHPTDDDTLIDRHMAGILTGEEEARLEALIRTSPDWARRYREAEDLVRLLHDGLDAGPAPAAVKQAIHRRVREEAAPRVLRAPRWGRVLAVAAAFLLVIGAAVFWPGDGGQVLKAAHANPVPPLKDLARISDVLLVGRTVESDGAVRLVVDRAIYGDPAGCACELPEGTRAGQHVALFGCCAEQGVIRVLGGADGIVHLDGVQRWEGADLAEEETRRRIEAAASQRTLASALADLRAFLASDASHAGTSADGLSFSAEVTARFLGRFEADATREDLMRLVMAAAKRPEVRNAGAEALVEADPVGTCRTLLTRILAGPVEQMHAETEDGLVVLGCLHLIQEAGREDLADDLARFAERVTCPGLKRAAQAAHAAALGEGPRTPERSEEVRPTRIVKDGREAIVIPACEGEAKRGLLVVPRDARPLEAFRMLTNAAVARGYAVLLLPPGTHDVRAWIRRAAATGRVPASPYAVTDRPGEWLLDRKQITAVLDAR